MTILQSTALVSYNPGQHPTDVQILIDDRELFNKLPGKSERKGVKSLASWPFFVTAIFNDQRAVQYIPEEYRLGQAVREEPAEYQLPIFDYTTTSNPTGTKARKHKVDKTLAEIRRLHEDLNAALYARPKERPSIHSPSDAYKLLLPFLGPLDHEELWVVNLDTRNRVMSLTKLYQGSVNMAQVRVGEVFRQAIIDNSPSIILSHNHPSTDTTPSPDDVALTRGIIQAGKLLDINVLDHVVVGASSFVSLKERGLAFGG